MKNALLTFTALMIAPTLAFAQGSGSSGSDGFHLKDDTVILMDPFVERKAPPAPAEYGKAISLPIELKAELQRSIRLMAVYSLAFPDDHGETLINNAFLKNVFSSDYREVEKIPDFCPMEPVTFDPEKIKTLPEGTTQVRLACSTEEYTFLVKGAFDKASLREQAKTIIHERLHHSNFRKAPYIHSEIAYVTDGLEVALDLLNRQLNGERPILADAQIKALETMQARLRAYPIFGPVESVPGKIYRNGGGLINLAGEKLLLQAEATHEKNGVYLGMGTVVTNGAIGKQSELIDAGWFCGNPYYNFQCTIGERSKLIGVYGLQAKRKVKVGNDVVIERASVDAHLVHKPLADLVIGDRAVLTNSHFGVQSRGFVWGTRLKLTEGSQVKNLGRLTFEFKMFDLGPSGFVGGAVGGGVTAAGLATAGSALAGPVAVVGLGGGLRALFTSAAIENNTLKFDGVIEGQGDQSICDDGGTILRDNLGYKATIRSRSDLERRCARSR